MFLHINKKAQLLMLIALININVTAPVVSATTAFAAASQNNQVTGRSVYDSQNINKVLNGNNVEENTDGNKKTKGDENKNNANNGNGDAGNGDAGNGDAGNGADSTPGGGNSDKKGGKDKDTTTTITDKEFENGIVVDRLVDDMSGDIDKLKEDLQGKDEGDMDEIKAECEQIFYDVWKAKYPDDAGEDVPMSSEAKSAAASVSDRKKEICQNENSLEMLNYRKCRYQAQNEVSEDLKDKAMDSCSAAFLVNVDGKKGIGETLLGWAKDYWNNSTWWELALDAASIALIFVPGGVVLSGAVRLARAASVVSKVAKIGSVAAKADKVADALSLAKAGSKVSKAYKAEKAAKEAAKGDDVATFLYDMDKAEKATKAEQKLGKFTKAIEEGASAEKKVKAAEEATASAKEAEESASKLKTAVKEYAKAPSASSLAKLQEQTSETASLMKNGKSIKAVEQGVANIERRANFSVDFGSSDGLKEAIKNQAELGKEIYSTKTNASKAYEVANNYLGKTMKDQAETAKTAMPAIKKGELAQKALDYGAKVPIYTRTAKGVGALGLAGDAAIAYNVVDNAQTNRYNNQVKEYYAQDKENERIDSKLSDDDRLKQRAIREAKAQGGDADMAREIYSQEKAQQTPPSNPQEAQQQYEERVAKANANSQASRANIKENSSGLY